jgi:hypothetical protein
MAKRTAKSATAKRITNELPKAEINLTKDGGFQIRLAKIRKAALLDQGGDVLNAPGQGCISAPGGPRC